MENFIKVALAKKGHFASAEWERPCATYKSCQDIITKRTIAKNIRIGANYENLQTTKQGRADGTLPSENQGLRGKEWVIFPILLKNPKTNKEYIRVEVAKNSEFKVQYFINGKETTKENIEHHLCASEKSSGKKDSVFDIAVTNIINLK